MATLKNILSLSSLALLVSACGAKSQLGYNYGNQNQANGYSQVMAAGTFAGSLPQLSSVVQSPNVNQTVPIQSPANASQNVAPILNQTSQDFGYLNDCYRSIMAQANGYFQSGVGANDIFWEPDNGWFSATTTRLSYVLSNKKHYKLTKPTFTNRTTSIRCLRLIK